MLHTCTQTSLYKQNSIYKHAQVKVMVLYSLPEGDMGEYTKWIIRLINYLDCIAYTPTLLPPPAPKKYAMTMQLPFLKMWESFTPTGTCDTYSWRQQYLFFNVSMSLTEEGDNDFNGDLIIAISRFVIKVEGCIYIQKESSRPAVIAVWMKHTASWWLSITTLYSVI